MACKVLLNESRFQDVKRYYMAKGDVHLSDDDMKWISNFVEIVMEMTHHRIGYKDILEVNDHLDDVLRGRRPEIAIAVEKKDSGRLLMGLMNEIRATYRLSKNEKRWFAYCIIIRYYLRIIDDETGKLLTGLVLFESVDKVKFEYNYERGSYFFETVDNFPKYDTEQQFGYSPNNPITTVTVRDSYIYLKSLRIEDGTASINRIASVTGTFGEMLDKYEVTITNSQKYEDGKYYFYVNAYGLENSTQSPVGFKLY